MRKINPREQLARRKDNKQERNIIFVGILLASAFELSLAARQFSYRGTGNISAI